MCTIIYVMVQQRKRMTINNTNKFMRHKLNTSSTVGGKKRKCVTCILMLLAIVLIKFCSPTLILCEALMTQT